jgi:hypothetical protein
MKIKEESARERFGGGKKYVFLRQSKFILVSPGKRGKFKLYSS